MPRDHRCADGCDGEHIICRRCGDETNHVPPALPPEWDGYCPKCAMHLAYHEETLPRADVEAVVPQVMKQIEKTLTDMLGADVKIVQVPDTMDVAIPDEGGMTIITRQCMN